MPGKGKAGYREYMKEYTVNKLSGLKWISSKLMVGGTVQYAEPFHWLSI